MKKLTLGISIVALAVLGACTGIAEATYTTMDRSAINVTDNGRTVSIPAASIRVGNDTFFLTSDQYLKGRTPTTTSTVVVNNDVNIYKEAEVLAYVRDLAGDSRRINVTRNDCDTHFDVGPDGNLGTPDDVRHKKCEW